MKRALLLSLVAAVACGKPPLVEPRQTPAAVVAPPLAATTTPDAPFRAAPPPPLAAPDSSHRPAVTAFALTNGIRVLSAYLPGPLCAVTVAMPSYLGAKDAKPGALSLFTTSLRYGGAGRSSLQLTEAFTHASAHLEKNGTDEALLVDFEVPPEQEEDGLKALGDLFRSPTIEPSAFALDQQFLTDWLSRPFDHPAGIVAHVTRKKLLGALHPYAEPYGGTVAEVRALKIADVLAAFRRIAEPRRIRIATAGSCDPDKIRSRLERAFGDLRGDARSAAALPAIPALPTTSPARRVYVVDRPQSALSHVRWAWTGATASERFTLRVLQMWAHLRAYERLAKATDLTEDFDVGFGGDHAGLWLSIGGRVVSARTAELLAEIGRLVDEVGAASSTAAIQTAKARLLGGQAMTYERARDVSRLLARDTFGDFQGDPLARIEAGAAAVTTADVQALAKRMLSSRTGTVVIVGDEATVRAPLAASGWGAPETCDPDGNPLKH